MRKVPPISGYVYFDLSLKKKKKTISKCQEDKNVTQETKQKLINQTHVHMKYNIRHDVCNVSKLHRKKIKYKCISFVPLL